MKGLEWAREIARGIFQDATRGFREHLSECEAALGLLSDEDSRLAWQWEIAFKSLQALTNNPRLACERTKGVLIRPFERHLGEVRNDPVYQRFNLTDPRQQWVLAETMVCIHRNEQYRYRDLVAPRKDDEILDIGACFGESALWFSMFAPRKIYCFEIDPDNRPVLEETIRREGIPGEMVVAAVGDEDGTAWYSRDPGNAGGGTVHKDRRENADAVRLTTIDTFVKEKGVRPSFIKMDIEGAEQMALRGAAQTLREFRPRLAVSLYHKPEDMWEIPLLISEMLPGAKMYCKKSHPFVEMVLFVQP